MDGLRLGGMNAIYHRIDSKMLSRLCKKERKKVDKALWIMVKATDLEGDVESAPSLGELLDDGPRHHHFLTCPFCCATGFVSIRSKKETSPPNPCVCVFCGETEPFKKIEDSIMRTRTLLDISQVAKGSPIKGGDKQRILREQALVVLATGLEIFFRDAYGIMMNARYVKDGHSLCGKFREETRNIFTNLDNVRSKFVKDLELDVNEMVKESQWDLLKLTMAKRNVIVHNAGTVDAAFIGQCKKESIRNLLKSLRQNPELKKPIQVSARELSRAIVAFDDLSTKIRKIYEKENEPYLLRDFVVEIYEHNKG